MVCPASAADCAGARAGTNNEQQQQLQHGPPRRGRRARSRRSRRRRREVILPDDAEVRWAGLYWGARLGRGHGRRRRRRRRPADEAAGARRHRVPDDHGRAGCSARRQRRPGVPGVRRRHVDRAGRPVPASTSAPTCRRRRARTATPGGRWWSCTARRRCRCATSPCSTGSPTSARATRSRSRSPGSRTPVTGTVNARIGLVAYEGDLGSTGDRAIMRSAPTDGRSWPRRCRRAPTSSTAPTTTTARW